MRDHTYDNVCLPHARVRQPLWVPEPTNGRGSVKGWRPYPPALAARWTDHVRSLTEVWLDRVRQGRSHKRLKKRYRLMRMALSSCRALRERPGGLAEGLHTWFEGC